MNSPLSNEDKGKSVARIVEEPEEKTDCLAFCNNCPKVNELADKAYNDAKGESIHYWGMPDDDPEVKYWKEIWKKGFTARKTVPDSEIEDQEVQRLYKLVEHWSKEAHMWRDAFVTLSRFDGTKHLFSKKLDEATDHVKNAITLSKDKISTEESFSQ